MADVFVGPIIEKLIGIGFEYLKDQNRWQKGMKGELKRLQKNLPQIQSVVRYASDVELVKEDKNPFLNTWLWQLRDAIDEAEDVMEELEYLKLQKQLTKTEKPRKVRSIMRWIKKRLVQIGLRALKIDPTLKRLEEAVHKLDEVSAEFATFLHLVNEVNQEHQNQQLEQNKARETGYSYTYDFIGRGDKKEYVMEWLKKTSNDNIDLLSVVGQGGMGKTTLLQDIYKKEEMKNYFDLKIWICVSNYFNVKKVIADILECIKNKRPRLDTLIKLQETLEFAVKTKKFLLVLDDIWEEENEEQNKSKWEKVLYPFASGALGSKILVSTRMGSVSAMLSKIIHKKVENVILEGLNNGECLQLLHNHAFNGVDPADYSELRPIAEKMVEKLSGSPLATKVIGGVLNSSLDVTHWNSVLKYKIGGQKDIFNILKLSYIFLPKVLQNCFSFCCTFPQDYVYDKDELVRMWIALGFIQPDNTRRETMKVAGERYFDTLVQKSLFDKCQVGETYYKLHDLLHEMLRTFSAQECLSIVGCDEDLLSGTPKTIRHLFVKNVNPVVLKKVEEFKHLRSFILVYSESREDLDDILAKIFKILRSIRLIYIEVYELKQIPKEIEDLIHLQYLKIDGDIVLQEQVYLPVFWRLPFLKYLILYNMLEVKGFDYKFHGNDNVRVFPSLQVLHIRRLIALETLFVATEASYECLFPCVTELYLEDCSNLLKLIALDPKFEKLEIDHIFPLLQVLHIRRLEALETLFVATEASYECLFPCLTELHLHSCPNLLELLALPPKLEKLEIGRVFPSLQVLHLMFLPRLEDWFVAKATTYECLFPCLTELLLVRCPNLLELPAGLPLKLEKSKIHHIGWKSSNWLQSISTNHCNISISGCQNLISLEGHQKMDQTTKECQLILRELVINDPSLLLKGSLTNVTSIRKLEIKDNNEVISFSIDDFEEWFLKVSSSLRDLSFESLELLQFLPVSLKYLSSLESLEVRDIPLLQLLPNMPASLQRLVLNLPQLQKLPDLPPSLEILNIDGFHELMELPDLPPSLEILNIEGCHELMELPDLPPSLCQLELYGLSNLHCLPSCLPGLLSLKELRLYKLPRLRELPDLPPSLETLQISFCNPVLLNRYQRDTGSDWHKIAHIPKVSIQLRWSR